MKKKLISAVFVSLVGVATFGLHQASAGERPPAGAKPLSAIVKSLEDQGYSPVTEASMDNGVWEIEAYKNGQARELRVNPATAKIISERAED